MARLVALATATMVAAVAFLPGAGLAQRHDSLRVSVGLKGLRVSLGNTSTGQTPAQGERDSLTLGGRTIPAGTTVDGPIVAAGGNIEVFGTIRGNAVAIAGDVVVHPGGQVTGDAIAAFGNVHKDSGVVGGVSKSLTGLFGASVRSLLARDVVEESAAVQSPLRLSGAWFLIILLISIGVLVFASSYLEVVVDVLGQSFWKSFLTGILGELGVIPAIGLIIVALAITVLGALLIPFAIVAAILAIAGLATLGFVAVARITGDGLAGRRGTVATKGGAFRGVVIGIAVYMGLWVVASAIGSVPVLGTVVRLLALLVTYVAVTAGFGAALLSRGGIRRDAAVAYAPAPAIDETWQTPTPVAGVVAAARRTPSPG
jgi:hypothetical protein